MKIRIVLITADSEQITNVALHGAEEILSQSDQSHMLKQQTTSLIVYIFLHSLSAPPH
jgi:hypothetical protein